MCLSLWERDRELHLQKLQVGCPCPPQVCSDSNTKEHGYCHTQRSICNILTQTTNVIAAIFRMHYAWKVSDLQPPFLKLCINTLKDTTQLFEWFVATTNNCAIPPTPHGVVYAKVSLFYMANFQVRAAGTIKTNQK